MILNETESETTVEDDEMKEVDDMIRKATRELEQVAGENKHILDLLEAPNNLFHSNDQSLFSIHDENFDSNAIIKQLEEAEQQAKDTAGAIFELKTRVGELLKRDKLTEEETVELENKNDKLKEEMVLFEERTKKIQYLIEKTNLIPFEPHIERTVECPHIRESKASKMMNPSTKNIGDSLKTSVCPCWSENYHRTSSSVPTFAKKLSQSYNMQEKLAAENADLETLRFTLQEELVNKDQTLEHLQRDLGNLQTEMRLLSRENTMLNEKLKKLQQNETKSKVQKQRNPSFSTDVSSKFQEYSDNTYQLEKHLTDMENDIRGLHEEISAVKSEREHLEKHRQMMCLTRPCITPHVASTLNTPRGMCMTPTSQVNRLYPQQILKELLDQYDKLEIDLKSKLNGVIHLGNDYGKLKNLTDEAVEYTKVTEHKIKECEKNMSNLKVGKKVSGGQEKLLTMGKERFKHAQDTLQVEHVLINEQKKLLEDIKNKYLQAQQQLDVHRQRISSKMDNTGINTLDLGSHIVTNLQEKLEEIII